MQRRVWLPIAILGTGLFLAFTLFALRPSIETRPVERPGPVVRVLEVQPRDLDLVVRTNGTVVPRTESEVVAEVAGTVTWVSRSLVSGGFFDAGEPLLRIDPRDYDLALESARAALQRAESQRAYAKSEVERKRGLARRQAASQAELDVATNAERVAAAAVRESRAALERAKLDRARTEIAAPYAGRVRNAFVDVAQFVTRGRKVARIYAVDRAEVHLPIPDAELGFLDIPLLYRDGLADGAGPEVLLRARFAGDEHVWRGRVVRTEGEIDPKTRMINVIVDVQDPYARDAKSDRPPLAVGLFVEAEIQGRRVENVFVLPRSAMRDANHLLVVDSNARLEFREVEILRADRHEVVVRSGLEAGERVCVSPLDAAVDGMTVQIVGDERTRLGARS
jgi:RND family efflux transporter MFP subunit